MRAPGNAIRQQAAESLFLVTDIEQAQGKRETKNPSGRNRMDSCFLWWAEEDSNLRLPPCEDGTLTAELPALGEWHIPQSLTLSNRKLMEAMTA